MTPEQAQARIAMLEARLGALERGQEQQREDIPGVGENMAGRFLSDRLQDGPPTPRRLQFLVELTDTASLVVRAGETQVLGAAPVAVAEKSITETTTGTYYIYAEYTYGTGWTSSGGSVVLKGTSLPTEDSTKRVICIQKFEVTASAIVRPLDPQAHVGTLFVIDWENCG